MGDGEIVAVNGNFYTKQQCYIEALRCDPNFGSSWHYAGFLTPSGECFTVNGKEYSKQQCYRQALRFNPNVKSSWGTKSDAPFQALRPLTSTASTIPNDNVASKPFAAIATSDRHGIS